MKFHEVMHVEFNFRLFAGDDLQGNLCGLDGQMTDGDLPLVDFKLLYYSMNVTEVVNNLAGGLFSDTNTTAFDPEAVGDYAAELFDPWNLFESNGNSLITELSQNFVAVCLNECDYNITDTTDTTRLYVWPGPTDPDSQTKWAEYVAAAETDPSLMAPFTFTALPESVCPYSAENCVPLQYATFEPILDRYCVPKITDAISTYVPEEFSSVMSVGFGDMLSDLVTSWPVILIMAFGGLAISLGFLWILRLCVGVFIWIAVWLCFLLILASAVTVLLYAQKCAGESMFASAVAIDTTDEVTALVQGQKACPSGYSIQDSAGRESFQIISYVLFALAGLYLIAVIVFRKRIKLGIAINKVASQFVRQNVSTVFVPLFQCLFMIGWWAVWLTVLVYTITVIPEGYRDMNSTWPGDYDAAVTACAGESGVYIRSYVGNEPVFACKETKWVLTWEFWYSIFCLMWMNGFILSVGQTIIAGAVGVWYFTPNHSKSSLGTYPIRTGFRNTFIYHLGTVAFGSLILAAIRFVRFLFFWNAKAQASGTGGNKLVGFVTACIYAFLKFVEKVVNFLNKNAFIQTALMGTNFCVSCAHAVSLVVRNAGRIGTLAVIGAIVHFLGLTFITAATGLIGWAILAAWFDGQLTSPIAPIVVFIITGYCIGSVVISVFSIAVDSILQCFVSDEELHKSEGGAKFTPTILQQFLSSKQMRQDAKLDPVPAAPRGQVSVVRASA